MGSKYTDTSSVLQVIGCVYNNPELLELTDKYVITEEDFTEELHKIIFGTIYKLHELGVNKITLESINDFLDSRPKFNAIFKKEKGDEWLANVSNIATDYAFDYYYNRLKKMTLLRAYDNFGVDVSDIYDPDNILDVKKKQIQEEFLDNSSLEDIATKIDNKIESIKLQYINNSWDDASQAGEGIYELIENFKKYPEVGIPLYGPLINTVTKGARLKKFYLRSAATGIGKAIPNDTIIPTPNGYRKVLDIKPGDYLFGEDGKPTKILQIHPQPKKKDIWKITFSDGRIAKCCGEHLWEYRYKTHQGYDYRVEDIQTIYNRSLILKNGLRNNSGNDYRFHIKINKPVEYSTKYYSIDPYIMGAFLSDDDFRYNKINKDFQFYFIDKEFSETFCDNLKNYPEIWSLKSEDKFIPNDYLLGNISQRLSLLQGLLDTNGNIDEEGRITFTTVSIKLRDDIIELCHSLGYIANYLIDKYTAKERYIVCIQTPKQDKKQLFRLAQKIDIAEKYCESNKRDEYKDHLAIINIEKTSNLSDMTCFTVDNDSHLFLMNDFIVTHNTRSMIADACYIACNQIYDDTFGWISTGVSNPTLFIATEQDLSEIQTLMLSFISGVNEEHILNGKYEGDEDDRILKAAEIIKQSPLYVEELPDFSLQDIENKIKKNIRDNNVKYVFLDYIHSSMKILEEITRRSGGVRLREDNILFMLSTKLKDICNTQGVFIMSATQLNSSYQDSETPDQNLLRGAKSIGDRVDFGSILLAVTKDDLSKLEPILSSNIFDTPTIKMSVYKNRRGRYKGIYLWCKADLGTCRIKPMFCTGWDYEIMSIDDIKIQVKEESAF